MSDIDNKIEKVKANLTFVDLGLSVLWCNTNIEAEEPDECGVYLSFGEVEPKKTYSERTYVCGGYRDAAFCNGCGRIPTREEWIELKSKCVWEDGNIGKTNGVFVTGPNGNVIFLPKTGKMEKSKRLMPQEVYAWTSDGMVMNYNKSGVHIMSESAYNGCVIRSVTEK